ncbi:DsbA family protein [Staphylococcus sp. GDY8P66P]|uniref:DsbA family protein n=1 Tax=unclassified Staphylococcus TaxID=91994 RepID=UPI0032AEA1B4
MMKRILVLIIIGIAVLSACNQQKESEKKEIIVYGDYKCPYCKEVEEKVMPKLKKEYIVTDKAEFKFINMAFLGRDSIKGSRAGHAVKNIAPSQYLDFQKSMFGSQPNNKREWITNKLLDKKIDGLDISKEKASKIKKDYKTKDSQSWKDAQEDIKEYKDNDIKQAPTVFVDKQKIEDPYKYSEYEQALKNNN